MVLPAFRGDALTSLHPAAWGFLERQEHAPGPPPKNRSSRCFGHTGNQLGCQPLFREAAAGAVPAGDASELRAQFDKAVLGVFVDLAT